MQGMQVQSLAGELRIHMLCGTDKKKKYNSFNWVSFLFFFLIYFWLCLVLVDMHRVSLVEMSQGGGVGGCYFLLWCTGFPLWWLLMLREHRL